MNIPSRLSIFILPLTFSACGGGSPGNPSTPIAAPVLSEAQKNFESMALASNGGLHFLIGYLSLSSSPPDALVFDPESFFFTRHSTIPQSAASGPQPFIKIDEKLATTLSIPDFGRSRVLVDGAVYVSPSPSIGQISYSGNDVLYKAFAADGKTVISSYLYTSYTVVPLSGLIANSPREFLRNSGLSQVIYPNYSAIYYDQSASWQAGAAYMKTEGHALGDSVLVEDCTAPATTGVDVTPCSGSATTLEAAFPITNFSVRQTYQFYDGAIVTLAGVRAWVARLPVPEQGSSLMYRVYYQSKGKIYTGLLTKDETTSQPASNFFVYLNNAAVQSIKSALKF